MGNSTQSSTDRQSGIRVAWTLRHQLWLNQVPPAFSLIPRQRSDDGVTLVTESFSDFLSKLRPIPGYEEFERSPYDRQEGIHAASHGGLGVSLSGTPSVRDVPNTENILRKAAARIAEGKLSELYITEDSFRFQDLQLFPPEPFQDSESLDS